MNFKKFILEIRKARIKFFVKRKQIRSTSGLDPVEALVFRRGKKFLSGELNRFMLSAEFLGIPKKIATDILRAVDYENLEGFPRAQRYRRLIIKHLIERG